ncbi:MAG: hypothetical protein AMXMBFR4_02550 [Candidatus Hydrogenedentota bacterium]
MADLATRFDNNPILTPADLRPSRDFLEVACVLNPAAFRFNGKTCLLLRVAERPTQQENSILVPLLDPNTPGGYDVIRIERTDPDLDLSDPRLFTYRNRTYLTTISHFRLASSDDGRHFTVEDSPTITGQGPLETFGIEDCRVTFLEGRYILTYNAVSPCGVGINMITTENWADFTRLGMVLPPDNKDCAVFDDKIAGRYVALHRPSNVHIKGNHIWIASSPDLRHWGAHRCIAMARPGQWDGGRVGGGCAPIRTPRGWLAIYHGADPAHRYCLGALLLDLKDPARVIARSREPIMEPRAPYEQQGFFGGVVFTNGHLLDGDTVTVYYGASDSVVCGATMSIAEILETLEY